MRFYKYFFECRKSGILKRILYKGKNGGGRLNFEDIYELYYDRIYRFCYLKLGCDKQLAEDCTQDVFLILLKKIKKINITTSISAWLYGTASKQINNYYRKMKNDISLDSPEVAEIKSEENFYEGIPYEILDNDEFRLLEEFYVFGENIDELARIRNKSVKAMYQQIRRIKQKILKNSDRFNNL